MSTYSKNPDSNVLDLVDNALHRTRIHRVHDIASNEAASELKSLGATVLPTIESVVMENCNAGSPADSFAGLSEVLVTYFDLAKAHDLDRACSFLKSLKGEFQVEGVTSVWSIWIGRSTREPIPTALLAAIEHIASVGTTLPREKAAALLKTYSKTRPR